MIYLDLDGVLADNISRYVEITGSPAIEMTTESYWKCVNDYQAAVGNKWFEQLPLMKDAYQLLCFLRTRNLEFRILTATGHEYIDVSHQKRKWCNDVLHIDELLVITAPSSEAKAAYAGPNHILIDDSKRSIDSWVKYGGVGILHTSTLDTIDQLKNLWKTNNADI